MTKEELLEKPEECFALEPEEGHEKADKLLLEYIGEEDITDAFNDLTRWYA